MKFRIAFTLVPLLFHTPALSAQTTVAVVGATLIDGTGRPPQSNSVILVQGDRIIRVGSAQSVHIPQNARRIDASGKFALPGLIDTHVHLEAVGLSDVGELPQTWNTADNLRKLVATDAALDLISGFTTVRDLGSTETVLRVRDEIDAGKLIGPRILCAGMQLVKRDSTAQREPIFLEYDGPVEAQGKVRFLARLGVDVIKVRLTRSRAIPTADEVRAIVEEAHGLHLRVTVHCDVPADDLVQLAINAGADGIEHNAPLRSANGQILRAMAQHGMSVMAGSGAFYCQRIDTTGLIDSLDIAQTTLLPPDVVSALRAGIDSLHRQTGQMKQSGWSAVQRQASFIREVHHARNEGVLLVFGTDCGAYGAIHGEQWKALFGETQLGSSPVETLLMATRDAAKAIGKGDQLGTLEAGKIADLIIVDDNPLTDLRNIRHIFRVIKDGRVYDPKEVLVTSGH